MFYNVSASPRNANESKWFLASEKVELVTCRTHTPDLGFERITKNFYGPVCLRTKRDEDISGARTGAGARGGPCARRYSSRVVIAH
ncbi:hypothetical protein EVAR_37540_1 [Eumeta japonica]|uniref:Uncharacterized protein n=1 Tax=Eumeta variegata TaxID=151549 RepID=A0A4C1XRC9_EUMVA|nr:hypothetical protein EVAR_37540_1 [Eumeta japonica]